MIKLWQKYHKLRVAEELEFVSVISSVSVFLREYHVN